MDGRFFYYLCPIKQSKRSYEAHKNSICSDARIYFVYSVYNENHKPVYAFGVAASFNDSVVYCTEIQVLDSTALDKNGFLPKRDLYSYQLKNYLEYDLKKPDYTCMIYFSENKKKLEKEAVKVKAKYKKSTMVLQAITSDKFSFKKPEE